MSDETLYRLTVCQHDLFGICDACKLTEAGLESVAHALACLAETHRLISLAVEALEPFAGAKLSGPINPAVEADPCRGEGPTFGDYRRASRVREELRKAMSQS